MSSAEQLLTTLLGYNPYNSNLDLKVNQEMSKQAEAELRDMAPAPSTSAAQDGEAGGDGDLTRGPAAAEEEAGGEGRSNVALAWPKRGRIFGHRVWEGTGLPRGGEGPSGCRPRADEGA